MPGVENPHLVGVITTSDILQALFEVMGAPKETGNHIDFVLDKEKNGLAQASRIVSQEKGNVLGSELIEENGAKVASAIDDSGLVKRAPSCNCSEKKALKY